MKSLVEYINESIALNEDWRKGGYWAEYDGKNYHRCDCQLKIIRSIDFSKLIKGSLVHAYGVHKFKSKYPGYCRFEKVDKDKWKLTKYTSGIDISDSKWRNVDENIEMSSKEMKDAIMESKDSKETYDIYVPCISPTTGDYIGVKKSFYNNEPSHYIDDASDITNTSFTKMTANINADNRWGGLEIIRTREWPFCLVTRALGRGYFTVFIMTAEEIKTFFDKNGYDLTKVDGYESIETVADRRNRR